MVTKSVDELLTSHVSMQIESLDRIYLNAYQPLLQLPGTVASFIRNQIGHPIASTASIAPMSRRFVENIEHFAADNGIEVIPFRRGQRKDDIMLDRLARFPGSEGVLFIGKAQEKVKTFRTVKIKRKPPGTGTRPWIVIGSAMPNQYYFYILDDDFGPMFIKFSSYFPYTGRVCLNGHEWLKRQLTKEGIAFEPLDNGLLSCADPQRAQDLADSLDADAIDAVFRKWLARLPHPFSPQHRQAGYRYDLSVLQIEMALTQVFLRPLSGRHFFEAILREHLDLGRPSNVQLLFDRRITKRTPGRFSTRIVTKGVIPALNVRYKNTRVKQYFKESRALRTETTINDTDDFRIKRRLSNLPQIRDIGFNANRRLLRVQHLSHDPVPGDETLRSLHRPVVVDSQRASALRFADDRVMHLMTALCVFVGLPDGFRNRDLRSSIAQLLGVDPATISTGRMTYDLRRLRLHGLIQRIDGSYRYHLTDRGIRVATVYSRLAARVLRPAFGTLHLQPHPPPTPHHRRVNRGLDAVDKGLHALLQEANLAA